MRYRGHVSQLTGYQGFSISVFPETLPQKRATLMLLLSTGPYGLFTKIFVDFRLQPEFLLLPRQDHVGVPTNIIMSAQSSTCHCKMGSKMA
jgi:hypothetical protein